jgi:hypothetical protein
VVSWSEAAPDFDDGGLRDIYVFGTTPEDWETAYRFLIARYPHLFRLDGVEVVAPPHVHPILGAAHDAAVLLALHVDGLHVNCHFFTADEIELDLDPREVVDDRSFQAVTLLLSGLGRLLDKRAVLTYENSEDAVILEYAPGADAVRHHRPRFG